MSKDHACWGLKLTQKMPSRLANFGFNFALRNWPESFYVYSSVNGIKINDANYSLLLILGSHWAIGNFIWVLDTDSSFQNNGIFHDHTSFFTFSANNRFDLDLGEITCDIRKNVVLRIAYLVHKLNLEQNNVNQSTIYGIPVYSLNVQHLILHSSFNFNILSHSSNHGKDILQISSFFCNYISNVWCSVCGRLE